MHVLPHRNLALAFIHPRNSPIYQENGQVTWINKQRVGEEISPEMLDWMLGHSPMQQERGLSAVPVHSLFPSLCFFLPSEQWGGAQLGASALG